jgi:VPDSG-CTERM motif
MSNSTLKMKSETPVLIVPSRFSLRLAPILVIAALIAFYPAPTRAGTIAFSITNPPTTFNVGQGQDTLGYAFTLSSQVTVTDLGFWDQGSNGLGNSRQVTIWNSLGVKEAQGTVLSGTMSPITNGFRYVSIAPVVLPAGSYTIGAFYPTLASDEAGILVGTITPASGITYGGSRAIEGDAFPPNDAFTLQNSYFGPNFQFTTTSSVPDTGTTCSLFGLSLAGLAFLRRKILAQRLTS